MSLSVDESRVIHVYARDKVNMQQDNLEPTDNVVHADNIESSKEVRMLSSDGTSLEEVQIEQDGHGNDDSEEFDSKADEEDPEFVDSDYDLHDEDDDDDLFEKFVDMELERDRTRVNEEIIRGEGSDETVYAPSDELRSCSSSDESDIDSRKIK
eukprot:XP_015574953.1 glutamic acid-rich protein-like [Ricinus communis]